MQVGGGGLLVFLDCCDCFTVSQILKRVAVYFDDFVT